MRNQVYLTIEPEGFRSHFKLSEFVNGEGVGQVHPKLLARLEKLRTLLWENQGEECWVIITNATRTEADNAALGASLGWADEGGAVSRDSKHLTKYGGVAVDIKAFTAEVDPDLGRRVRVSQGTLGGLARQIFPFVKDDYGDGHVHVDCWDRARDMMV